MAQLITAPTASTAGMPQSIAESHRTRLRTDRALSQDRSFVVLCLRHSLAGPPSLQNRFRNSATVHALGLSYVLLGAASLWLGCPPHSLGNSPPFGLKTARNRLMGLRRFVARFEKNPWQIN